MDYRNNVQPMEVTPIEFLAASGGLNGQGVQVVVVTVRLPNDIPANGPRRAGAFMPTNMLLDAHTATRLRDELDVALRQAAEVAARS